jgi:hypothetical protein
MIKKSKYLMLFTKQSIISIKYKTLIFLHQRQLNIP